MDKEVNDPELKVLDTISLPSYHPPKLSQMKQEFVNIDICISRSLPNETKLKLGLDSLIGLRKSNSKTPCLGYLVLLAFLDALVSLKTMFKIQ